MTKKKGINAADGSSVNDNASTESPVKRAKKSPAGNQKKPKNYPPEIEDVTQKIKKIQGQELAARVEIGLELRRAKNLLEHGQFRLWVRREFRWSERTASTNMQLARHYDGKTEKFADLDLGTALALVADPTLEKVRDEVFKSAEAGEKITRAEVRKQIAEVKSTAPKRPAKAKTVTPSPVIKDELPLAASRAPGEEIAEAMQNLLSIVQKTKHNCWPETIAMIFLKDKDKQSTLINTGSLLFISYTIKELISIEDPNNQMQLAG